MALKNHEQVKKQEFSPQRREEGKEKHDSLLRKIFALFAPLR